MTPRILIISAISVSLLGCTTTRSTPLDRTESNQLHKSLCRNPKGIPITIKVPTHVDVYIYETLFFSKDAESSALVQVRMQRPTLWVDVQTIETEKVVTVDWKRPFSGSLNYEATMGDDQYFDTLGATIVDTTIEDVTAAVKGIAGVFGSPTSKGLEIQGTALIEENRVVAFQRFDIDACDLEDQILAFVDLHVNSCNNCQGGVFPSEPPVPHVPPVRDIPDINQ